MTFRSDCKQHLNLYYIFKEDKEKNALSEESATELFEKIFSRINIINCHSGTSPP